MHVHNHHISPIHSPKNSLSLSVVQVGPMAYMMQSLNLVLESLIKTRKRELLCQNMTTQMAANCSITGANAIINTADKEVTQALIDIGENLGNAGAMLLVMVMGSFKEKSFNSKINNLNNKIDDINNFKNYLSKQNPIKNEEINCQQDLKEQIEKEVKYLEKRRNDKLSQLDASIRIAGNVFDGPASVAKSRVYSEKGEQQAISSSASYRRASAEEMSKKSREISEGYDKETKQTFALMEQSLREASMV